MERWATFDCYGTLVDWNAGIHAELEKLFGVELADGLLVRYHELEPKIQAANPGVSYREVLTLALEALAAETGLTLPEGETSALAHSLPTWPVFDDVQPGLTEAHGRGWKLGILSNTDRDLIDAFDRSARRPVRARDRRRRDRLVQAGSQALGGLLRDHRRRSARPRPRCAEPLPRHRPCAGARHPVDLDQPSRRARRPAPDRDAHRRRRSRGCARRARACMSEPLRVPNEKRRRGRWRGS